METLNWKHRRRLSKYNRWFLLQLKEGNIELALEYYESRLEVYSGHLSKETRMVYYYYKWLVSADSKHFQSIKTLRIGSSSTHMQLSLESMQESYYARKLSTALADGSMNEVKGISKQELIQTGNPILKIAWILSQLAGKEIQPGTGLDRTAELEDLQNEMPSEATMPEKMTSPYYQLVVYMLFHSEQYEALSKLLEKPVVRQSLGEYFARIQMGCIFRLYYANLLNQRYSDALGVMQNLARIMGDNAVSTIFPHHLIELTGIAPNIILEWIDYCIAHDSFSRIPGWETGLKFVHVLALLKMRQIAKARMMIDQFLSTLDEDGEVEFYSFNTNIRELRAFLLHLKALSYINETTDWQLARGNDSEEKENIAIRNLSLWRETLPTLTTILQDPQMQNSSLSWRNRIIDGMVLFTNTAAAITNKQIESFRDSIDHFDHPHTRQKLQGILGELVIRSRATEEAIAYLMAGNTEKLLELFFNVILPQGDTIPSMIRISVILSLWENDRSFSAITHLKAIKKSDADEQYINQAIEEVLIYEILKKLENECLNVQHAGAQTLPSLEPLSGVPQVKQLCELASRVIHLKNENWENASRNILQIDSELSDWGRPILNYIQFYAGWQTNDAGIISELYSSGNADSFIKSEIQHDACKINSILYHIQSKQNDKAFGVLTTILGTKDHQTDEEGILSFCLWLLEHKHYQALIQFIGELRQGAKKEWKLSPTALLLCSLAEGLANSGLKQYSTAEKIYHSIIENPGTGSDPSIHTLILGWCEILEIYQNVIGVLNTEKEAKVAWAELKRRMTNQDNKKYPVRVINLHVQFIVILLAFIDDTRIINKEVLLKFPQIAVELGLRPKTPFLEDLIRRVSLRNKIIEDFWAANSRSDFEVANNIYEKELAPIFKTNIPFPIQIVKVMIDWSLQKQDTISLINQLNNIQNTYPEADADFITKVRNYIKDGDKLKHLAEIIKSNDYRKMSDFVSTTVWEGYKEGTQPVQVALAQLLAFHKLTEVDKALALGKGISGAEKLVQWAKDFGNLLLGYVYYNNNKYDESVTCFEKISRSKLNGHDVNNYWAASHYAIGLQFLGKGLEGKENEAFDAFARAMSRRGISEKNLTLAPLFIHIGMINLKAKNGSKALASFRLASKTVTGLELTKEVAYFGALAAIGEFVCRLIMKSGELTERNILDSLQRFELKKYELHALVRDHMILFLVVNFKSLDNSSKAQITRSVKTTINELEEVQKKLNRMDPVFMVLKALDIVLLEKRADKSEALTLVNQAMSLGLHSEKLNKFLTEHFKKDELKKGIFEIFALYLGDVTVDDAAKDLILRNSAFENYYKLNKGYTPDEIYVAAEKQKTSFTYIQDRLKLIEKKLQDEDSKENKNKDLLKELREKVADLNSARDSFSSLEKELLHKLGDQVNK